MSAEPHYDLLVAGGGINGIGIARDAAGRGLKVALFESGDLGGATSSASSKLVHGGLRYLEFHAYGMVRKALQEREILLRQAPHICRPMSFLLPVLPESRSPALIRAALFLYDHLAHHREVPNSRAVDLRQEAAGPVFSPALSRAFRYWDGFVDDARLVILNARDAAARGADIFPREALANVSYAEGAWRARSLGGRQVSARFFVNATGPWAAEVAAEIAGLTDAPALSLVQGAHIITRRINRGADAWTLQQPDGRIIFVIPYEQDFSLIGTTETPLASPGEARVTEEEATYLLAAVNTALSRPLVAADIIHRFAGIRPLVLEEGKGARETTRDWKLWRHAGVPALTVIGGKLTTYRRLAEDVLAKIAPQSRPWTAKSSLPGADFPLRPRMTVHESWKRWIADLVASNPEYDPQLLIRLAGIHGTDVLRLMENGLGENLGGDLHGGAGLVPHARMGDDSRRYIVAQDKIGPARRGIDSHADSGVYGQLVYRAGFAAGFARGAHAFGNSGCGEGCAAATYPSP